MWKFINFSTRDMFSAHVILLWFDHLNNMLYWTGPTSNVTTGPLVCNFVVTSVYYNISTTLSTSEEGGVEGRFSSSHFPPPQLQVRIIAELKLISLQSWVFMLKSTGQLGWFPVTRSSSRLFIGDIQYCWTGWVNQTVPDCVVMVALVLVMIILRPFY